MERSTWLIRKFSPYFLKKNTTVNYLKPNQMNQGRNKTQNILEMLLTWIVPKSCMLVIHEHVQFTFMSAIDSSFCCSLGFFFWKSSIRFFILLPISAKFRYIFCEKRKLKTVLSMSLSFRQFKRRSEKEFWI